MDQTDSEGTKVPGPDGNQENKEKRSSIELKKLDVADLSKEQNSSRPEIIYRGEDKPGSWMFCLKCTLILLNTFIWILGAAITGIGIWIAVDKEFWNFQLNLDVKVFSTGIYVGIAAGIIILIIGLIGCIGAWKQSTCLLITFAVIIVLLILLEAAAMGIVWATANNNNELQEHVIENIRKAMDLRFEYESIRYFFDLLQAKLECCGVENDEDFGEDKAVPDSCRDPSTGRSFPEGCLSAFVRYLKSKAGLLGGVAASVFALQIVTLSLTVCLCCGLRQAKENIF